MINKDLKNTIGQIELTYGKTVTLYERLLDLKIKTGKTADLDKLYADSLSLLGKQQYSSAAAQLVVLEKQMTDLDQKLAAQVVIPQNVPVQNTPPSSGYSRQTVASDMGQFMVSMVSADLNSTRLIVDTASSTDCANDCPALPLATYVSRNNAFAGVNGSYFCPPEYPTCAGKTNSFDTLLMNKDKHYFNSDNNVYSVIPAAIFMGNSSRFVEKSSDWGRDTSVDAVIANHPLLLKDGRIVFGGDSDPKLNSKSTRSFVGATGSTVYIGVVHNASVMEMAHVLATLGISSALNLDDGGSAAFWSGGYKVGPGRNIPNAVLLIRK